MLTELASTAVGTDISRKPMRRITEREKATESAKILTSMSAFTLVPVNSHHIAEQTGVQVVEVHLLLFTEWLC